MGFAVEEVKVHISILIFRHQEHLYQNIDVAEWLSLSFYGGAYSENAEVLLRPFYAFTRKVFLIEAVF